MPTKYRDIIYKLEGELRHMRSDGRTKLPTEAELVEEFGCSRQTVRAALSDLEQRGLIVRRRGSGSYLSDSTAHKSDTVIFICEDEDEYIYPALTALIRNTLKDRKLRLICRSTHGRLDTERLILTEAAGDRPAAVLIEPFCNMIPNPNLKLIMSLREKGIPVIYLFTSYDEPDMVCVREDNEAGASILVRHLASAGHSKIAMIYRCDDSRGLERYSGYISTMDELGLPLTAPTLKITSDDRRRILSRDDSALKAFAAALGDATAVICHNDEIAFRLSKLLGDQVAVVSFDDSYYASPDQGAITSLSHPMKELSGAIDRALTAAAGHKKYKDEALGWVMKKRKSG